MKLKAHDKKVSEFSEIDKIILIPKKISEEFALGAQKLKLDGKKTELRVYDVPCNCNKEMHTHRVVDLRDVWDEMDIKDGDLLEIERW